MRCKVHVLDRLSGRVLAAELNTDSYDARPEVRITFPASRWLFTVRLSEGRPTVDSERFELLPFPTEDELGAPSFDGGTP